MEGSGKSDTKEKELAKMERVRSFLLNENIINDDSFVEYMNTL